MQRTPTTPPTDPRQTPPDESVWSVFGTGYAVLILVLAIFAFVLLWMVLS
jgi:hypothetical protein